MQTKRGQDTRIIHYHIAPPMATLTRGGNVSPPAVQGSGDFQADSADRKARPNGLRGCRQRPYSARWSSTCERQRRGKSSSRAAAEFGGTSVRRFSCSSQETIFQSGDRSRSCRKARSEHFRRPGITIRQRQTRLAELSQHRERRTMKADRGDGPGLRERPGNEAVERPEPQGSGRETYGRCRCSGSLRRGFTRGLSGRGPSNLDRTA